eukprot:m.308798 g.308798  ORF g.308798 m.308798 type:complete len:95 (-) comp20193_c0_seq2:59-343(-)
MDPGSDRFTRPIGQSYVDFDQTTGFIFARSRVHRKHTSDALKTDTGDATSTVTATSSATDSRNQVECNCLCRHIADISKLEEFDRVRINFCVLS